MYRTVGVFLTFRGFPSSAETDGRYCSALPPVHDADAEYFSISLFDLVLARRHTKSIYGSLELHADAVGELYRQISMK